MNSQVQSLLEFEKYIYCMQNTSRIWENQILTRSDHLHDFTRLVLGCLICDEAHCAENLSCAPHADDKMSTDN